MKTKYCLVDYITRFNYKKDGIYIGDKKLSTQEKYFVWRFIMDLSKYSDKDIEIILENTDTEILARKFNEFREILPRICKNKINKIDEKIKKIQSFMRNLDARKITAKQLCFLADVRDKFVKQCKKERAKWETYLKILERAKRRYGQINESRSKYVNLYKNKIRQAKNYDIIQLAEELGFEVKKAGKNFFIHCPFHTEKRPSCCLYPEFNIFYCFGCGAKGDVITFYMKVNNTTFKEAVDYLTRFH